MGLYDVPAGIKPITGLLVSLHPADDLAAAGISGQRHTFGSLGPDLAVGIHGVRFHTTNIDADAESIRGTVSLDPDISLTEMPSRVDGSLIYDQVYAVDVVTSGAARGVIEFDRAYPAPFLTVRNITTHMQNAGGAQADLALQVLYSVYEVSERDFVRLAGISLSRG